ncbi:9985_t:CDS:2, partial [Ambispora leptoticha]
FLNEGSHESKGPRVVDLTKSANEKYDVYVEVGWPTSSTTHLFLKCNAWPIHLVVKEDKHIKVLLKDGSQAILFPIKIFYGGDQILAAVFICGINPCSPLEDEYMKLFHLVMNHFSVALTR